MRRPPRPRPDSRTGLAAHVTAFVWGPAEFVGPPPRWLLAEGILVGALAVSTIVGVGIAGVWTGHPALAAGEGGLVIVGALALYLVITGAGRALVGIATMLGLCLALLTPQVAGWLVLTQRGEVRPAVVTLVEGGPGTGTESGRYLCSVADRAGAPLSTRIWRGCAGSTRPGDALTVVFDPKGAVPPRGVAPGTDRGPLLGVAAVALALVVGCALAVVRSFRLDPPS
ncbi:hypothetical protein [Streptomyces sp. ATCC 21386]|uniref:hypothetical protein n=1 Tax=Streptomyces sp. ATCC 21386 TaxID=2699428 RepID=UPI0027E3B488|nr:hypothetical protein [Streptomyces sp. ATCC 21386]